MLRLFDDLVSELPITAHELVSHVLELLLLGLQLLLHLLVALLALQD